MHLSITDSYTVVWTGSFIFVIFMVDFLFLRLKFVITFYRSTKGPLTTIFLYYEGFSLFL